ncbi:MAG TPA: GNAT family N-acetyltransferase [Acidimicrobiales bacterium]|nr:GNAT family N-acetyltransferase [Acidimicrobiales bacterium]
MTLELVAPDPALGAAFLDAHAEWGPGLHEDGFGLLPTDDVATSQGFAAWIGRLAEQADPGAPRPPGRVRCTPRWVVEEGRVLGGIALRHELTEVDEDRGHIGYGVRPSARRRGVATWALTAMLGEARTLGLGRVLLVCAEDNVASARTIERCGGVLGDIRRTGAGPVRRYWIMLDPAPGAT